MLALRALSGFTLKSLSCYVLFNKNHQWWPLQVILAGLQRINGSAWQQKLKTQYRKQKKLICLRYWLFSKVLFLWSISGNVPAKQRYVFCKQASKKNLNTTGGAEFCLQPWFRYISYPGYMGHWIIFLTCSSERFWKDMRRNQFKV